MKITLTSIAVFIGVILADGILLPSLFHIYGSFLAFAFLAALLVVYGNSPNILILLLSAAFVFELWHGYYFLSVMVSALCAAALWQWLSQFFSIEPFIKHSRAYIFSFLPLVAVGYVLVVAMSVAFLIVEKYIYRSGASWTPLVSAAASPAVWLTTGAGLIACMLLMRLPGYKAMPASGKFYI